MYKKVFAAIPNTMCRITLAWTATKLHTLLPKFVPSNEQVEEEVDLKSILLKSDLIYKYSCPCGALYIGETMRRLDIRMKEHEKKKSSIQEHLKTCGEIFDRGKFSVVASGLKGKLSRKKYETLYIKYYMKRGSCMNTCEVSRNLSVF